MTRFTEADTNLRVQPSPTFETVYEEHAPFVRCVLARMGIPAAALDDAVQDVFLVWVRRGQQFRGDAEITTYLHAIARRVAANLRRSDRRARRKHEAFERDPILAGVPNPEESLQRRRRLRVLEQAVATLPPKLRTVYTLAVEEGLSAKEIGARLGVSPNTVSSRLRLGRARIARAVEPEERPRQSVMQRLASVVLFRWRAWAWPSVTALLSLALGIASVQVLVHSDDLPKVEQTASAPPVSVTQAPGQTEPRPPQPWTPQPQSRPPQSRPPQSQPPQSQPPQSQPPQSRPRGPRPQPALPPVMATDDRTRQKGASGATPSYGAGDVARLESGPDSLGEEAALVATAQRHMRSRRFAAAVAVLERHQREFPRGVLRDERTALLAAALCAGGQLERGRQVANRLASRSPSASALATTRAACSFDKNSTSSDEP
ncbi:MAG: sigma-70 family RNA polymerase sigma factor [Myxococcota bacterium]